MTPVRGQPRARPLAPERALPPARGGPDLPAGAAVPLTPSRRPADCQFSTESHGRRQHAEQVRRLTVCAILSASTMVLASHDGVGCSAPDLYLACGCLRVLRLHYHDALSIDRIGALLGVHRATAARWIRAASDAVRDETRRLLHTRLGPSAAEIDSLDSLAGARPEPAPPEPVPPAPVAVARPGEPPIRAGRPTPNPPTGGASRRLRYGMLRVAHPRVAMARDDGNSFDRLAPCSHGVRGKLSPWSRRLDR